MKEDLAIYIHIPFCESKCIYCAFASFVSTSKKIDEYFEKLKMEIASRAKSCDGKIVKSIYFGGGTPTCVAVEKIQDIMRCIRSNFQIDENCEINIECNPNSATFEKLKSYKTLGFTRVSFGVQSLYKRELKFLNRLHTKKQALSAIKTAKLLGFNGINSDLLIGLKTQSVFRFKKQIFKLKKCGVNHFSCYMISVENGTKLYDIQHKNNHLLEDDECVELYEKIAQYFKKNKYNQYEISNFAIEGFECKHNGFYWDLTDYMGFGLSAHSYFNECRMANTSNLDKYLNGDFQEEIYKVSFAQKREEMIMLALRTKKGLDLKQFQRNFNQDLFAEKKENIEALIRAGLIEINGDILTIKPEHFGQSNSIILELI